jgi:predicted TPR repeat methyltransferase
LRARRELRNSADRVQDDSFPMTDQERAKALFYEALDFLDASDFQSAELRLRDALTLSPGTAAILTNLALTLLQQGRTAEARRSAGEALAANPDNVEALLVSAHCCTGEGNYAEALAAYDRIIALDATIAEVHNNRGMMLEKLGRKAEAIASYDRALAIEPGLSAAHVNLGNALDDPDPDQALAAYDKALALKPDLAEAWLGRGNVYHNRKRYDDALAAYEKALAVVPHLSAAELGRGNALCRLDRPEEGIRVYQETLAREPGLAEAWLGIGNALCTVKRHDEALAAFDRALSLQPDLAEAWFGRGNVFNDRKRYDEALAAYDKAVALNPDFAPAWLCRGDMLRSMRRPEESIAAYQQALKLGGDAELIQYCLGALGEGRQPDASPENYVVNLFDSYAENFDQDLVVNLKYRIPGQLADTVKRFVTSGGLDILDMGCGTGLMGEHLRPLARTLTGVDLSPKMLEKARRRGVYETLIADDLVKYVSGQRQAYDLVVAADVFIYIGDLSAVFMAVRTALKDGGLFGFSVEEAETDNFVLKQTLRYGHSVGYLRALAEQNGFVVQLFEPTVIRQDFGTNIGGYLTLMRLPPA